MIETKIIETLINYYGMEKILEDLIKIIHERNSRDEIYLSKLSINLEITLKDYKARHIDRQNGLK